MIGKKEKNWCYTIPRAINLLVTYTNTLSTCIYVPKQDYKGLKEFADYINTHKPICNKDELNGIISKLENKEIINKYLNMLYDNGDVIADMSYMSTVTNIDTAYNHLGQTLWSGRYCAISAFIIGDINDRACILANKRGKGTPDFQGYWNCPCGFLEGDETAEEGCAREVLEETGLVIKPSAFKLYGVQTDPATSNNGNVSLRYTAIVVPGDDSRISNVEDLKGGELNEVEEIRWMPLDEIDTVKWAFNHKEIINEILAHPKF